MNRETRENTFDIALGLVLLAAVAFSVYAAKTYYADSLGQERQEAYKARETRLRQRVEIYKSAPPAPLPKRDSPQ